MRNIGSPRTAADLQPNAVRQVADASAGVEAADEKLVKEKAKRQEVEDDSKVGVCGGGEWQRAEGGGKGQDEGKGGVGMGRAKGQKVEDGSKVVRRVWVRWSGPRGRR